MRYDGVIHLVTAADGADTFFEKESNEARYETIKDAIQKDKKIKSAYQTHPKWFCIDNKNNSF